MKFDGNIRESWQEDELNSEKCGTGGHSGKTCLSIADELVQTNLWYICKKDLGLMVERSRGQWQ